MKRGLVIDIGNTRLKAAVFEGGEMLADPLIVTSDNAEPLKELVENYQPSHSLVSVVGQEPDLLMAFLSESTKVLKLSTELIFPFKNEYATPHTLGMDRAAAIAGAMHFFSGQQCLVIDTGTCVTYDFVTQEGSYLGGAISPGVRMRLKAMHTFTRKLPDLVFEHPSNFIGNSTSNSMLSGVYFGLLGEINETIERYEDQFGKIQVIVCGGDATLFDKHTKKSIFAAPDLVLYGLFKILQLNAT